MNQANLVAREFMETPRFIAEFIDFLILHKLTLYASDIFELLQMENEEQFTRALDRTIQVLNAAGIPAGEHIMPVFTDFHRHTIIDYKMSPLAFGLMCMHMEPVNARAARWQVEWIKKAL